MWVLLSHNFTTVQTTKTLQMSEVKFASYRRLLFYFDFSTQLQRTKHELLLWLTMRRSRELDGSHAQRRRKRKSNTFEGRLEKGKSLT